MKTFSVGRACKIRPREQGGRTLLPPGFRANHIYQVINGFVPPTGKDLHFVVVNEMGAPVVFTAEDVILVDPLDPSYKDGRQKVRMNEAGVCKVKAYRGGIRPGFRPDHVYTIIDTFTPANTTDLHFIVTNEEGTAVVLRHDEIVIMDPNDPAYPVAIGAPITTAGGSSGTGQSYVFNQEVAATTWIINHTLPFIPGGVQVVDSAGNAILGDIQYIGTSQIILTFNHPFSGTAYLS